MRYDYHWIIIFWAMVATVPTFVFLIQVFMLVPMSGLLFFVCLGIADAVVGEGRNWGMALFFMPTLLITWGLWAGITTLFTRLIWRIPVAGLRPIVTLGIVGACGYLATLPIYGSGGHGPTQWASLLDGKQAIGAPIEYALPPMAVLAILHLLFRWWRPSKRSRSMLEAAPTTTVQK
jgi:hypothetical protein